MSQGDYHIFANTESHIPTKNLLNDANMLLNWKEYKSLEEVRKLRLVS
jgi:hypothetical protein